MFKFSHLLLLFFFCSYFSVLFSQTVIQDTLVSEKIIQKWNGNDWENFEKETYEYNLNGQMTKKNTFSFSENTWKGPGFETYYHGDADTISVSVFKDSLGYKYLYGYNNDNKLRFIKKYIRSFNNANYYIFTSDFYSYNTIDNIDTISFYYSTAHLFWKQHIYKYNVENQLESISEQFQDTNDYNLTEYKYYGNGKSKQESFTRVKKDIKELQWVKDFEYDNDLNTTTITSLLKYDGKLNYDEKTDIKNNSYGYPIESIKQDIIDERVKPIGIGLWAKVAGITLDNNGVLYGSEEINGIFKVNSADSLERFAPKGGESFYTDIKFGWSNSLFGVRGVRAIFSIAKDNPPDVWHVLSIGNDIIAIDFDSTYLWCGTRSSKIIRISSDKKEKEFDFNGTIKKVRYFDGDIYIAATRGTNEVIIKIPILENGELGTETEVINLSNEYPDKIINCIAFANTKYALIGTDDEDKLLMLDLEFNSLSYFYDYDFSQVLNIEIGGNNVYVVQRYSPYSRLPDTENLFKLNQKAPFSYLNKEKIIYNYKGSTSSIVDEKGMDYELQQNYPNPFNNSTKLSYLIKRLSFVRVKVLDILGRTVQELVNNYQNPGRYVIDFDGNGLASGIYFYQLTVENYSKTMKMILLK